MAWCISVRATTESKTPIAHNMNSDACAAASFSCCAIHCCKGGFACVSVR